MKTYVVSLKSSKDRRQSISNQLNQLGIEFQFFDAIDGKGISEETKEKFCDENALKDNPRWLNPGAIGCALSHAFLYDKISKEHPDGAVILEDDMICSRTFKNAVHFIEKSSVLKKTNCVVLFYYRSFDTIELSIGDGHEFTKDHFFLYPANTEQIPITTGGYYISQHAAKSLKDFVIPVKRTADCWSDFLQNSAISTLLCAYPRPLSDACFKSEIDYNEKYKNKLISVSSRIVNRLKPPFLYGWLKEKRKAREAEMSRVVLTDKRTSLPLVD